MELALVENLQRKDLTAFEEAEALLQLQQKCGHTHEDLARKLGKSTDGDYRVLVAGRQCPMKCEIFVGWPTLPLSPRYYR